MPDERLVDAVEQLRENLYEINQQLMRVYVQLTFHETHSPAAIQSETFSVAMNHLADQVRKAAEHAERIQHCTKGLSPE